GALEPAGRAAVWGEEVFAVEHLAQCGEGALLRAAPEDGLGDFARHGHEGAPRVCGVRGPFAAGEVDGAQFDDGGVCMAGREGLVIVDLRQEDGDGDHALRGIVRARF
ncbi:MAG: hypothetical protein ACK559_07925, partial [bacterium]